MAEDKAVAAFRDAMKTTPTEDLRKKLEYYAHYGQAYTAIAGNLEVLLRERDSGASVAQSSPYPPNLQPPSMPPPLHQGAPGFPPGYLGQINPQQGPNIPQFNSSPATPPYNYPGFPGGLPPIRR